MNFLQKGNYKTAGLIVFLASFILFFIGVKVILGAEIGKSNIIAFLSFSVVAGLLAVIFAYFKLKVALTVFSLGLIGGFVSMYAYFLNKTIEMGDVIGVVSLLKWAFMGLAAGLILQLFATMFQRGRKT